MKFKLLYLFLILGIIVLVSACAKENPYAEKLKNIDAVQALEIANEWHWSNKGITSFVTPREVVFTTDTDKVIKKIPLPEDKMVVAVAPYINKTHK